MAELSVPSARAFDAAAADYDALRRGLVPCFDAFYGAALELIDDWRRETEDPAPLRVLDLGAGTGLFASLVLASHPGARLHLLDGSSAMLAEAEARLAATPGVSFEQADMASAPLGGPYDLVISALAIHHLEDTAKQELFARILGALRPVGLLVNAEQVLGPTPQAEARYRRLWQRQVAQASVPEAEIANALERMRHDRCATVEDQLLWLRQAGFADVDCSFKAWRFAVYSGRRP